MEGTHASQVDAILGALTMPDIGQLFPDNDPRLQVSPTPTPNSNPNPNPDNDPRLQVRVS